MNQKCLPSSHENIKALGEQFKMWGLVAQHPVWDSTVNPPKTVGWGHNVNNVIIFFTRTNLMICNTYFKCRYWERPSPSPFLCGHFHKIKDIRQLKRRTLSKYFLRWLIADFCCQTGAGKYLAHGIDLHMSDVPLCILDYHLTSDVCQLKQHDLS